MFHFQAGEVKIAFGPILDAPMHSNAVETETVPLIPPSTKDGEPPTKAALRETAERERIRQTADAKDEELALADLDGNFSLSEEAHIARLSGESTDNGEKERAL